MTQPGRSAAIAMRLPGCSHGVDRSTLAWSICHRTLSCSPGQLPLSVGGVFGQDAAHRRPQVQRLALDADEPSVAKSLGRLLTDAFGCLGGGTGTARLRDNRHSTARPKRSAKLLEPRLRFGPHPEVVDRQRLVERLVEIAEVQDGSESQVDSTLLDRSPVAGG